MQQIEKTVREYGQKRNITDLQEYIVGVDVDEIKLLIKKRINSADFSTFWNYLLQSLDTENAQEKRFDIVTTCIDELKEKNINITHANSIITRLCMELPKFLTEHLLSLCVTCMGFIQKGNVTEACWKELVPELLNVIIEKKYVEFNLKEMSGLEFKIQYINSLCTLEWSSNIIIPLTAMFIEMPLTKEEHLQVVTKLLSHIERLSPLEVPAFVYQILKLCQSQNSRLLFHKLQDYFGVRIYNSISNGSTSESLDVISDSADEESVQAESTVFYHIYQAALLGHENIKDYTTSLKNLTKSPEFVLHPFQLSVLLIISTVKFYEDKVFELVRQCIARNFIEELKKSDSCWLRDLAPDTLNLEDVITKIIYSSLNERDLVIQGLLNLGFVLLGVGALLGRDSLIVKKQWNLGKFILLNLVKEKHHVAHTILQRLCKHIIAGNSKTQYVDCFGEFATKFTYITMENKSCLVELMEGLVNVPENCADTILEIVIPLTKISSTIRDHLILLLRKALYSRSTETRQIAVQGYLKLLTKLKISNFTALSQLSSSSSSGHSVLTQISLHRTGHNSQPTAFSNEAICLEVLNILKRCFMQQADVRARLYDGLYQVVVQNPDLTVPVLNVLWLQLLKYYNADENLLPPIDFSKTFIIRDADVILQEPIGQLTSTISLFIVKIQELEGETASSIKYVDVYESLCKRLLKCELIHFELDDGCNLLDVLPDCKKKVITLKEAMCLYESLIGYKVWSWNKSSSKHAEQIIGLFQGYFRLQQRAKNASKFKKLDKKTKDKNKRTQQNRTIECSPTSQQSRAIPGPSQATHQHQDDQNDSIVKNVKALPIKIPQTVLGFKILRKFLSLLHENVDWTTLQQANLLKVKHDVHRHVMQATLAQFQSIKNLKGIEKNKDYYNYCTDIGKIIYPRCIHRLEEFLEFDVNTAVLAVECFDIILNIVSANFKSRLKSFLKAVGNHEDEGDLSTYLTLFIEKYQRLFEMEDHTGNDQEFKRMLQIIVGTLTLLISHVKTNDKIVQVLEWMKTYSTEQTVSSRNIAMNFVNLWFNIQIKYKNSFSIFEDVISNLYQLFGSHSNDKEGSSTLKIIDELTGQTFIQSLTIAIKTLLECIEWIINRLRSEYGCMTYIGGDGSEKKRENLTNKERSVCCQMCFIITLTEALCYVNIPLNLSEYVIKDISLLYNILNLLTKYFILRSSKINPAFQNARFERVVRLAGRQLAPAWNQFILYIEEVQKEEVENTQAKKKNSSSLKNKVLKETKLIPKVVYEIEHFTKSIIQLSNKTKHDMAMLIGAGTTRDFRIRDIKNVMEKNTSMDNTHSDAESTEASVMDEAEPEENEDDNPPRKRVKT